MTEAETESTANVQRLVRRAVGGDRDALESLLALVRDRVYGLALRMLWHPQDAEDATQEILIKVMVNLGRFQHKSAFATWVFRIAANHLLTVRKSRVERKQVSFESCEQVIDLSLAGSWTESSAGARQNLVAEEIRLGCLQAILLCLDRDDRIAYALGEVFDLSSDQAAEILDIAPAAYRKRLSRARTRLRDFLKSNCGHFEPNNRCHCPERVSAAIQTGWVDPERMLFAGHRCYSRPGTPGWEYLRELDEIQRTAALFRSHPEYAAPERLAHWLREVIRTERYKLLSDDPAAGSA